MGAIIKKAYYYPLVVFLLTIGYGLLKIDIGDTNGLVAYGWIYIFTVMWFFVSLYIVAYFLLFLYILRKVESKQASSYDLLPSLIILLVINLVSFCSSFFKIMMPLDGITTYSGVTFTLSLIGMAIIGYLMDSKKNIRYLSGRKKYSKFLPTVISLGLVLVPVLAWWSMDKVKDSELKQNFQQILEKGYHAKGKEYQVTVLRQYPSGKNGIQVEYTLKDGAYEILCGAKLSNNNHGSYNIEQSTYVNLEQDYAKLATIQASSKAGQDVLKDYVNEINASLKRIKADDRFSVSKETNANSIYSQPQFSVVNLKWEQEALDELKESIAEVKKSNKAGLCEFDGWVSLKVPVLMSTGLLIPEITVNYDWKSKSDANDLDWEQEDTLRLEVEEKLISAIDYTKLIDGNYVLLGEKRHLLKVRNGKLVEVGEVPSRIVVENSNSELSLSSEYTKWK